jgi:hypothetical protein
VPSHRGVNCLSYSKGVVSLNPSPFSVQLQATAALHFYINGGKAAKLEPHCVCKCLRFNSDRCNGLLAFVRLTAPDERGRKGKKKRTNASPRYQSCVARFMATPTATVKFIPCLTTVWDLLRIFLSTAAVLQSVL